MSEKYMLVCGMETHIELSTKTKIFCSCPVEFGGQPNSRCCEVCTGQPGALPRLNERVPQLAVIAGLTLGCRINRRSYWDRKNYYYPDLPKAYQITQFDVPICEDGAVTLSDGTRVGIIRIHMEEDAGKLIHEEGRVLADYNRAGVPLIEIVSAPDITSAAQAGEYVELLRSAMVYAGITDGRMQEGSLRCDVNVSVRCSDGRVGERTEIKNVNSISNIERAIEYEFARQCAILERGEQVERCTMRYDDRSRKTIIMRRKEQQADYRYFREPDLGAVEITQAQIESLAALVPELPAKRAERICREYSIGRKEADILVRDRALGDYFEESAKGAANARTVVNFLLGQVLARISSVQDIPFAPHELRALADMTAERKITTSSAKDALEQMLDGRCAQDILKLLGSQQQAGEEEIREACLDVIVQNPKAREDYLSGKQKAVMPLVGAVMKRMQGRADAVLVRRILEENMK